MDTIRVIHNLPRSGGTIISKSISAQKNVVLLSEIHPDGPKIRNMMETDINLGDPLYQFQTWYGLFNIKDYEKLKNSKLNFLDKIKIINKKVKEQNKILILRDWSFVDYFGKPFSKPQNKNILYEVLEKDFEIKTLFLIREPLETFLSCMKLPFFAKNYTFDLFLDGYNLFINNITNNNLIKFEKFVENPNEILKKISTILNFEYDKNFGKKFKKINITGDLMASKAVNIYKKNKNADKLLNNEQKKKINKNQKYNKVLRKFNEFF